MSRLATSGAETTDVAHDLYVWLDGLGAAELLIGYDSYVVYELL